MSTTSVAQSPEEDPTPDIIGDIGQLEAEECAGHIRVSFSREGTPSRGKLEQDCSAEHKVFASLLLKLLPGDAPTNSTKHSFALHKLQ